MTFRFKNLSLRNKLLTLLCSVSSVALFLGVAALLIYDNFETKKRNERHMESIALVVGSNCQAALDFGDKKTAEQTLQSLRNEPSVEAACLYGANRTPFTSFYREKQSESSQLPVTAGKPGLRSNSDLIELLSPIADADGIAGYLFLRANTQESKRQIRTKLLLAAIVLICALAAATGLAFWLQTFVSRPIVRLANIAKTIKALNVDSTQATYDGSDEIGELYLAFDEMLFRIRGHEQSLRDAHEVLEQRVKVRTLDLSHANKELLDEISRHKQARQDLGDTQQKLVEAARVAGMADIATGVLHNVGNVLNSVNVRLTLMRDRIQNATMESDDLVKCSELLQQDGQQLAEFLTTDPQGRHVQEFLAASTLQMQEQWKEMAWDVTTVQDYFAHIRQIVASHQSLAKTSGSNSEFLMSALLDEAISFNDAGLSQHNVHVNRDYKIDPTVNSDRHRILQILVNLISNSKHAVAETQGEPRQISLSIRENSRDFVAVIVEDNGSGISAEDLDRIFQSGFTTKRDGHGYGLHTSAIAAQELGGSLKVASQGRGKGTKFALEVPKLRREA